MLLTVAKARQNTYIECMAETHEFTGTIVRIERDGFGIVQFNKPIGAQANAYLPRLAQRCRMGPA